MEDLDALVEVQKACKQAAILGWVESFRVMVTHGVEVRGVDPSVKLPSNNEVHSTMTPRPWDQQEPVFKRFTIPMISALENSDVEILEAMLRSGRDPNGFLNDDKDTPAHVSRDNHRLSHNLSFDSIRRHY